MDCNKKRVTIFINDTHHLHPHSHPPHGKVFPVPDSIETLLLNVRKKFQLKDQIENQTLKLVTAKGGEIDDIDLIRDDEILYVCLEDSNSCFCPISDDRVEVMLDSKAPLKSKLNDEWIKLNIGGKIFTTTRLTIIAKEPESMLAKMFECDYGDPEKKLDCDDNRPDKKLFTRNHENRRTTCIVPSLVDDQGAYMIDRSPEYFEPLIGYLRHGNLIIDKHLNVMGVLEEAKFYGFYSLIPELEATILQESLLQNTIERSIGLAPLTRKDVVKALIQTSGDSKLRFQGVNLSGADLSRLDLSNINFKYAILRGANLQGAIMKNCCLERADISKCNLEGAHLINCYMIGSNLEGSILRGSNMEPPMSSKTTNLERANLDNANLEGSKMNYVNLRKASLKNANAQNCHLEFACMAGANLENCDFSGSDLNDVNLYGANLKGTRFDLIYRELFWHDQFT